MNFLANPVLARELRGRIRGNRALLILTIYLLITGLITVLVYSVSVQTGANSFSDPEAGRNAGRAIFFTVMTAALVQVCVITPSLTAGAIAGEKERQSYDLLITTQLSPLQIALGKLASALAFALLLIIAALPLASLSFLFGGISGTDMVIGVIGLMATAVLYASVGLFWSTVMRSTLGATVMAQGTIIFSLLIIPFFSVIFSIWGTSISIDTTPFSIYAFGAMLCSHPFIALGITAATLSSGENAFFFDIPTSDGIDVLVPSPWLAYVFIAALITALCIFLTVRLLRPVEYGRPVVKKPAVRSQESEAAP
jgi:ABC-type transport system involved in multi-copper enzyme maturation permease subunit